MKAVIVAAGLGAFQPRKLPVAGAEPFEGRQLHYAVKNPEQFRGKDLVILGGGDSALDWVLALQPIAHSVVLIHRSNEFRAAPASVAKMRALVDAHQMQLMVGNVTGIRSEGDALRGINVIGADSVTRAVDFEHLLAFYGLSPKLGPIAQWGLGIDKNQITVDTERFETNVPGIYAVGDINTYPGKLKLILSGFHEGALMAQAAALPAWSATDAAEALADDEGSGDGDVDDLVFGVQVAHGQHVGIPAQQTRLGGDGEIRGGPGHQGVQLGGA